MAPPTHYETLGVARSASAAEVRAAYRAAARDHHPDAGGDRARMQALNAAWAVLGDPARRAAYDRTLARRASGPADVGTRRPAAEEWQPTGPDLDDLADDRPLRPTRGLEGWWAIMPPGMFVVAVALFVGAFVFSAPALVGMSIGAVVLSGGLFVLAPLRAMARRPD
jgi:hypothetical protein